ncbi:MAG: tripartite ATP-independent transporter DctM subunit [Candidatus Endobugula sp.]|jgi:tripartite ATP-independent transporter DctM subunit
MIGIYLFFFALILLFAGYPIALTFAGLSLLVGFWIEGVQLFAFIPYRLYAIMGNTILMAIPMFIFMGVVLQKTGLAERLLESMGRLFGARPGGLAISTIIVGAFLAASTGVVGASVVAMGVISLPVMLKYKYDQRLATGVICAAGTLGQIIPPSIILIILGDVMGVPVGDLFKAAMIPALVLVSMYLAYVTIYAARNPLSAPPIPLEEGTQWALIKSALSNIIPPLALIVIVLGSILSGIATPTESSALGAIGAIVLAKFYGKLEFILVTNAAKETVKVTSMVFAVLIGATAFSMIFTYSGGDTIVEEFMSNLPGEKWTFLLLSMLAIFVLGFFIDFVEIAFIVVPILAPIAELLGINMVWFAILIAMNLQSSFMTPPFGFSLFYLKGVSPPSVKTSTIYKGVIPFIMIQMVVVILLVAFPEYLGFDT